MSASDDDFDALLSQAEVKEDFMDCGFEGDFVEPPSTPVQPEIKLENERRSGATAAQGKKFKVKVVEEFSGNCFRYIGSGASFCLRKNCSIKHGTYVGSVEQASFKPSPGGDFVIMKSVHVAFTSPTLNLSSVADEVVDTWEGSAYSLVEWQDFFQASDQGEDVVMSITDIKTEAQAARSLDSMFQTPAKKSRRVVISEPDPEFEVYESVFMSNEMRSSFKQSATPATIADSVVTLDRTLAKLSKGVSKMVLEGSSRTRENEAIADKSFRMAKGLEGLVGMSKVMEDSDWMCPTVWGTLATIGAEVSSLKDRKESPPPPAPVLDLGPIKAEVKADIKADLKLAQAKLTASMTKIGSFSRTFAKLMLQRVSGAEEEIKRILQKVRSPLANDTIGDDLDGLLAAADNKTRRYSPPSPPQGDRLTSLEDKLNKVLASNEDLERRLARILADSEVDAVKFAGLGLKSVQEVAAWVAIHFPCRSYGLIVDAYLMFDLLADDGPQTQKDLFTEMKRRLELNIATEAEGQALTAFLSEVPRIFHTSSTSFLMSGDKTTFFSKVPSHKAWAGPNGLKQLIASRMSRLKMSLRVVLTNELDMGTLAYAVAIEALEKTITWIVAFIAYLDKTYEHLHVQVGFTSVRAWALTTQLGCRIFSDLYSVRVGTMKAMGIDSLSICPAILWSVFRTHDKMTGFELANFEDHPSIASEFVKFLATNTGIEGMAVLQEDIKELKTKVKEMDKQTSLAGAKADKAVSVADVAKKASDTLSKQVDKIAAKM